MATKEVPSIVASLSAHVKMTPIAWHIEPTYVVIVFEQGPKMRFERLPDDHPGKPVFVTKDDVTGHITKIADLAPVGRAEGPDSAPLGKTFTARRRPIGKKPSKVSSK
jgi:hypothetical protein